MPTQEDIDTQMRRLYTYRKSLQIYLQQLAVVGTAQAPAHVLHGISECRHNIHRIKSILRDWRVLVENHPDDTDLEQGQESEGILERLEQGANLPSFGD